MSTARAVTPTPHNGGIWSPPDADAVRSSRLADCVRQVPAAWRCWRRCAGPRRGRAMCPRLRACASFARGLRVARRGNIAAKWRGSRIGAHSAAGAAFTAATATAPAPAAAAALRELYATPERSSIFIVENIKCCQADVRDFLLTKSDFVAYSGFRRRHIRCRPANCGRRSACQRQ
jgi:hypothetical protein